MQTTIEINSTVEFMEYTASVLPTASSLRQALKIADGLIPDQTIANLNLEPIIVKIRLETNWSISKILNHYLFYKQFLYLCKTHKGSGILLTKDVDEVWHYHIQDTKQYQSDCQAVFGEFLHHFPYSYMGLHADDAEHLELLKDNTHEVLEKTFGIASWSIIEKSLYDVNKNLIELADCEENPCEGGKKIGRAEIRPVLETIDWNAKNLLELADCEANPCGTAPEDNPNPCEGGKKIGRAQIRPVLETIDWN